MNSSTQTGTAFWLLCSMIACVTETRDAFAQDNAPAISDDPIPVIVVTATRNAIDASLAPASVSVVDSADIEARGVVHLSDALKDLPGVFVRDNQGNPSAWSQQVIMRGVAGYTRNAVLIDGQSLNNPFSNGVNWAVIDPGEVERVEVVRGPFSSLYGGAAMGGVVNIITKRPEKRETVIKGGYGSDNLKSLTASYADRFGDVGLRLDAGQKESDGYIQDLVVKSATSGTGTIAVNGMEPTGTPTGGTAYILGDKGERAWEQQNAGISVDWDVTDNAVLTVGARYHRHENNSSEFNTWLTDASTGAPVTSGSLIIDPTHRITLRESDFLTGPNGEEVNRFTTAYEHRFSADKTLKLDAFYAKNDYWYVTPTAGIATANGGTGKFVDIPSDRTGFNATVSLPLNESHFLTAGLAINRDTLQKRERIISDWRDEGSAAQGDVTFKGNGENFTWSPYLQDEITVSPVVTVYAGLRYDHWTTHGEFAQFTTPTFAEEFSKRSKSAVSPKLSVVYTPSSATTLRASAGSAFRAPTLSDMYSTWSGGTAIYYANPDLKPETITAYEIGGERRLGENTVVSGTLFRSDLKDMIASTTLNDGTNNRIQDNISRAEIQGIELGLQHRINPTTTAFLNYTLNETEVVDNPSAPEIEGKKLTLIPDRMANAGIETATGPWSLYVAGRYVGKLYGNSENLDEGNGVYGSYDPYFVLDAKLGYRITPVVSAALSVFNALDREYFQSSMAPGRSYLAEVSARF